MNTGCERSTPIKWRKSPSWKTENNMVKPKKERKEDTTDKENRGVVVPKQRQRKKETLKNVSNLSPVLPSTFSKERCQVPNRKGTGVSRSSQHHIVEQSHGKVLASTPRCPVKSSSFLEELRAVTSRLQKLSFDKERTDKLFNERDAFLKQQKGELENKTKALEGLQLELKKLQKLKEFKDALCKHSYPLEQSLRVVVLSKEQEKEKKINLSNRLKETSLPYILCCQDQRNQMNSENQNVQFKDMGTIMGEKWKVLNIEDRKRYGDEYEAEKEACLQSLVQQKEQENEEGTDPNWPKKPQTPFLLSSKETRTMLTKQRPKISNTAHNALISIKCKELEETGKE